MKHALSCLLLLGLTVLVRADVKEAEEQVKQVLDILTKAIETLEAIKDRDAAEKAKPKLVKLFEDLDKAGKQFDKASEEDKEKLKETYKPKLVELRKRYRAEVERLKKDEGIAKVLANLGPFKKAGQEKVTVAQLRIATLDQAVKVYQLKNQTLPETLAALTEGDKPIIEKSVLKDPWGKAFQYDPTGPKNKGARPDIWTVDPDGKTIGNWNP
jgi:hypothetical protein